MLIRSLRAGAPEATFFGLGGVQMVREGMDPVVRLEEVAVMGITEVVTHMPAIYARYRRLKNSIRRRKPDVAVLIDFPDVNLRLAAELHRHDVPVVYFVSPQLWAWKRRRIETVRRFVTRMLVIFPFEEAFYREHGVAAEFVGHPLADLGPPANSRSQLAAKNGLDESKPWIGLLPGSRRKEIEANLPAMLETASLLGSDYEYLLPAAPAIGIPQAREILDHAIRQTTNATNGHVRGALRHVVTMADARAVLRHSRASVVASGTATVEAALMGNPFVVVYRISPLSYAVARRVIHLPHVAMVNLIAGRRIVPELIQQEFTAENVARTLQPLLAEGAPRATMQAELASLVNMLRRADSNSSQEERGGSAIDRVASIALGLARMKPPTNDVEPLYPASRPSDDGYDAQA